MSDTMLFGVLKMPFEMAMKDEISRLQYYARVQELVGRFEAQQQAEPVLQEIEQYRMQMAGISTAAIGYWKEGDGILPDYDTLALRDVAKLYAKYDELYKAQPEQQAEPVAWPMEEQPDGAVIPVDPADMAPPQQQAEPVCPKCKAAVLYECVACSSNNYPPKQQAEPVADEAIHAAWSAGYVEGEKAALEQQAQPVPRWDVDEDNPDSLAKHPAFRATPKQQAEPVVQAVIAGAFFDFMGWLTTRKERLILSSTDNASPAVESITEFAKMRGLSLDDARVQDWQNYTTPPQRQWVGLTEDDIAQAMCRADAIFTGPMQFKFAKELEAKLKERNT